MCKLTSITLTEENGMSKLDNAKSMGLSKRDFCIQVFISNLLMYERFLEVQSQCATQIQNLVTGSNHNSFARSDGKIEHQ